MSPRQMLRNALRDKPFYTNDSKLDSASEVGGDHMQACMSDLSTQKLEEGASDRRNSYSSLGQTIGAGLAPKMQVQARPQHVGSPPSNFDSNPQISN